MPETNESTQRILDGRAWEEFCDTLKSAGAVVVGPGTPNDAFDRAEGFRYLSRLTRAALDTFIEGSTADAPRFRQATSESIKLGMDNPDNVYLSAPVNGAYEYRILGTRGSVHYLGFGSQAGNYGTTGTLNTTGYLEAKDLKLDANGSFEIIVSAKKQAGNWLPMAADTRMVQVRQTRLDHENEILAEVSIERIDGNGESRALDPAQFDRRLQGAAKFVVGTSGLFQSWAEEWQGHTNQLPRFSQERAMVAGGDPNIAYYHSYWELAEDEALVVELAPPVCDFWNFQLSNHWLESLDYHRHRIHLNKLTASYRDDGSVRIVVAHQDPGTENWLHTCGHARGTMCVRWIRAESYPDPAARVVKFSELAHGES